MELGAESRLVDLVRSGNRQAFAELYAHNINAVQRVASGVLHDADFTADVVQETFARALEGIDRLHSNSRFRPWLLSIARHVALDQLSERARRPIANPGAAEEIVDSSPEPEVVAELRELVRLVHGSAVRLSPRDATALSLATEFGFSTSELAAGLGVSPGAAKVVLHRARRRLRERLTLELLVRRRGPGCEAFLELKESEDLLEAARHVRDCSSCQSLATAEVNLYQAEPAVR